MKRNIKATLFAFGIYLTALADAFTQSTFTKITTGPIVSDAANSLGSTWVDFDGDGDLDLYVNNGNGANFVYRNDGQGAFTKITGPVVNQGFSVSWADMDNDGRIDLFSTTQSSGGRLLRQLSPGVFTQSSVAVNFCFGAAWGDYDNDGFVDLLAGDQTQNVLWHNNGQGGLVAIRTTPIVTAAVAGGITWTDFDNDGDVDLLVAGVSSQLYRNDGAGVFTPVTGGQLVERGGQAGGANWGDYDNDGFLDLYLPRTDSAQPLPSFLFHNNGDGTFTQVEQSPFTDDIGFSVNASWGDYDNDGWLDLFATEHQNGMNRLYHNSGDGTFTRIISAPIADDVANCTPGIWGDYDRDGFLDLFVATFIRNSASPPNDYLYHNDGNGNAWITIKCVGTRSNRSAIGAKLRVKATIKGKTFWQLREITTGDGWGGIPLEAHFGLGNATNAEMLRIEWPSGTVQEFQNVAAKQYLTITEPAQPPAICSVFSPIGVFNNGFGFEVRGSPGQVAVVEGSTNLLQWFPLQTYRFTSSPQGFLDPTWRESTSRFYRLRPDFSK